ncbi:hypothetical protein MG293_013304 [Ovis ammon polii]|uniref:Uncharacterized protein n=1 Tax=Ovis ammon polii TaxID=230172 RepID=A0AAD4Y883_OVIAM|nr:hypothetical protein MG293_013304 [Ovis ammon polii]
MVSSPNIICSENGTWYLEVPKCEWVQPVIFELPLVTIVNTYHEACVREKVPSSVPPWDSDRAPLPGQLTRMVGSQNIFCSENKSWSPDVPKCEKVPVELCEAVLKGQKLLKCLPNAWEAKVALELHKLSLEIEKLEQEKRKKEIA